MNSMDRNATGRLIAALEDQPHDLAACVATESVLHVLAQYELMGEPLPDDAELQAAKAHLEHCLDLQLLYIELLEEPAAYGMAAELAHSQRDVILRQPDRTLHTSFGTLDLWTGQPQRLVFRGAIPRRVDGPRLNSTAVLSELLPMLPSRPGLNIVVDNGSMVVIVRSARNPVPWRVKLALGGQIWQSITNPEGQATFGPFSDEQLAQGFELTCIPEPAA